jgi:hypothetical protein
MNYGIGGDVRIPTIAALMVATTTSAGISQGVDPLTPPVVKEKNLGNWQPGELVERQLTTPLSSPPVIWSDIVFVGPNDKSPTNMPTLSENGLLTWQTSTLDAMGSYHFEMKATNPAILAVVPESQSYLASRTGHVTVDLLAQEPNVSRPFVYDFDFSDFEYYRFDGPFHITFHGVGVHIAIWSFTSMVGPADGPLTLPSVSPGGFLTWSPSPQDLPGLYYFDVHVQSVFGFDYGHLILRYSGVPEPSAALLLVFGAVLTLSHPRRG